jgi:hypothetical protein
MAVLQLFPTKDATIYSAYNQLNTGRDEIIEATTNFLTGSLRSQGDLPQTSRFLIDFGQSQLQNTFDKIDTISKWKATLKVYSAEATGLSNTTTIAVNALAENWSMGTGKYWDNPPTENGVSWLYKNYSNGNTWTTSSFPTGITASFSGSNFGGGVWYTGAQASQSFDYYSTLDINMDVTDIVTNWLCSVYGTSSYGKSVYETVPFNNYGFIVRQTQSQEFINNTNQQVTLKFFSRDTNTIYPPVLQISYDDFIWNTGSSYQTILNILPATVTLAQNPGIFYPESINRFRVNARPEFPAQIWTTGSVYTNNYFLPTESYWALKDLETNEYIVDFDDIYTKLSADSTSSYFDLNMDFLQPERYYTILIKSNIQGTTQVFDDQYYFKVING